MQFLNFIASLKINEARVPPTSIDSLTKGILYGLGLLKNWTETVALRTFIARGLLLLCLYNRLLQQEQQ